MPIVTATVSTPTRHSFRVHQVAGLFDLPLTPASQQTFQAEVPDLSADWNIGAIVGPSGSGKSTIAQAAFGAFLQASAGWSPTAAVIDELGVGSIKTITQTLTSVGFSSPPAWLRPYQALSNGERFRCDLARALLSDQPLIVCDEFTSVVDRTVAQVGSAAVAKAIRSGRVAKRFVAVTCHYDVLPWLEADWVLDMATGTLTRGRLRRPSIELRVVRARQCAWAYFARHHYLSGELSRGATCYVALWHDEPVAFCAVLGMLGHRRHKRVTRLVTLPDYQGLGIGTRLLEYVCRRVRATGERISITTSHPAMCAHLQSSTAWQLTSVRRRYQPSRQQFRDVPVRDSHGRAVASFEFVNTEPQRNGL
ncbi:MAG TPA: GNAT family N-acetyltransferase [Pirellulaceae bacterium]|nr:GNAT family N-acetyltransferase [Pirellulaceae bacterium]